MSHDPLDARRVRKRAKEGIMLVTVDGLFEQFSLFRVFCDLFEENIISSQWNLAALVVPRPYFECGRR